MAIVTLHDVHVAFGSDLVFDRLGLQLFEKEKLGMVGANGTGKSTLASVIVGVGEEVVQLAQNTISIKIDVRDFAHGIFTMNFPFFSCPGNTSDDTMDIRAIPCDDLMLAILFSVSV